MLDVREHVLPSVLPDALVDDDLVQLAEPAVRARLQGAPAPGTPVTVRLEAADPATRKVTFTLA